MPTVPISLEALGYAVGSAGALDVHRQGYNVRSGSMPLQRLFKSFGFEQRT